MPTDKSSSVEENKSKDETSPIPPATSNSTSSPPNELTTPPTAGQTSSTEQTKTSVETAGQITNAPAASMKPTEGASPSSSAEKPSVDAQSEPKSNTTGSTEPQTPSVKAPSQTKAVSTLSAAPETSSTASVDPPAQAPATPSPATEAQTTKSTDDQATTPKTDKTENKSNEVIKSKMENNNETSVETVLSKPTSTTPVSQQSTLNDTKSTTESLPSAVTVGSAPEKITVPTKATPKKTEATTAKVSSSLESMSMEGGEQAPPASIENLLFPTPPSSVGAQTTSAPPSMEGDFPFGPESENNIPPQSSEATPTAPASQVAIPPPVDQLKTTQNPRLTKNIHSFEKQFELAYFEYFKALQILISKPIQPKQPIVAIVTVPPGNTVNPYVKGFLPIPFPKLDFPLSVADVVPLTPIRTHLKWKQSSKVYNLIPQNQTVTGDLVAGKGESSAIRPATQYLTNPAPPSSSNVEKLLLSSIIAGSVPNAQPPAGETNSVGSSENNGASSHSSLSEIVLNTILGSNPQQNSASQQQSNLLSSLSGGSGGNGGGSILDSLQQSGGSIFGSSQPSLSDLISGLQSPPQQPSLSDLLSGLQSPPQQQSSLSAIILGLQSPPPPQPPSLSDLLVNGLSSSQQSLGGSFLNPPPQQSLTDTIVNYILPPPPKPQNIFDIISTNPLNDLSEEEISLLLNPHAFGQQSSIFSQAQSDPIDNVINLILGPPTPTVSEEIANLLTQNSRPNDIINILAPNVLAPPKKPSGIMGVINDIEQQRRRNANPLNALFGNEQPSVLSPGFESRQEIRDKLPLEAMELLAPHVLAPKPLVQHPVPVVPISFPTAAAASPSHPFQVTFKYLPNIINPRQILHSKNLKVHSVDNGLVPASMEIKRYVTLARVQKYVNFVLGQDLFIRNALVADRPVGMMLVGDNNQLQPIILMPNIQV